MTVGAHAYRRIIGRRAAASVKAKRRKRKQNKTYVTPEKDDMTSANQTPGGYKFAPNVAIQHGRANQHDPACFRLFSPRSFPSRSGILLHADVQPWLSLQRSISPRNVPPLVPPSCAIPPILGCSRPLVGVDAENSEFVQEQTTHSLFFLTSHAARAPHQFSEHYALRQSRILHARHKSREQYPPPA